MDTTQPVEILDIYDIYYQPFWRESWFLVLLIVVIGSSIIGLSYWLYKKQKKEITKSASEITLELLQQLQAKNITIPEQFYSKLTRIIKWYVEQQYQLPVMSTTDDEFLNLLQKNKIVPEKVTQEIKTIFNGVVMIKFAGQDAAKKVMDTALQSMIKLVKDQSSTSSSGAM